MARPPEPSTSNVVIVAIDGSKQAEHALDWYFKAIRKPSDQLVLVHAPEGPTTHTTEGMFINEGEWQRMIREEKQVTDALVAKYKEKLQHYGVNAKYETRYGKAGEAICAAAKDEHASLVVMGTRGLGTMRRTIMGSVSDYVVHHAHCPVVVCRQ